MIRAVILSPWTGTGATAADPIRPAVLDAFPTLAYRDLSGQSSAGGALSARPAPNIAVVYVEVANAVAAQIAADATWRPRVLWHNAGDRDADGVPDGTERAGLRARLRADGMTLAQAQAVVDAIPVGATRRQIAAALLAWLRDRPRA